MKAGNLVQIRRPGSCRGPGQGARTGGPDRGPGSAEETPELCSNETETTTLFSTTGQKTWNGNDNENLHDIK